MTVHPDPRLAILADLEAVEEIVRRAYSPYISRIGYAETHRAEEKGLRRVFMVKQLA